VPGAGEAVAAQPATIDLRELASTRGHATIFLFCLATRVSGRKSGHDEFLGSRVQVKPDLGIHVAVDAGTDVDQASNASESIRAHVTGACKTLKTASA
jgi:hypothetical protein